MPLIIDILNVEIGGFLHYIKLNQVLNSKVGREYQEPYIMQKPELSGVLSNENVEIKIFLSKLPH